MVVTLATSVYLEVKMIYHDISSQVIFQMQQCILYTLTPNLPVNSVILS